MPTSEEIIDTTTEEDFEATAPEAAESTDAPEAEDTSPPMDKSNFYGLDFREIDRNLSPQERQEWNSIYASFRGGSLINGAVAGVDRQVSLNQTEEMLCAAIVPFRARILIPEREMWMRGETRPEFVLRNMPGANVDFIVTYVDREGGFAIASRRLALRKRRVYFRKKEALHAIGARTTCQILAVGPRRCLVTSNGYDVDLTQRELSYSAIPDLRDVYHPGDTLDCIVKSFDPTAGKLEISVKETVPNPFGGAEFRHPVGSSRQGVISGKYAGGVFVNLPDGTTVMCSYLFHYDDADFQMQDKVIIMIERYVTEKEQIYGRIVAKC